MNKYGYEGDPKFRPLSPWAYLGYTILFSIPIVGFVLLIVFSIIEGNVNRKNYARSYFCALVIVLVLVVIVALTGGYEVLVEGIKEYAASHPV